MDFKVMEIQLDFEDHWQSMQNAVADPRGAIAPFVSLQYKIIAISLFKCNNIY